MTLPVARSFRMRGAFSSEPHPAKNCVTCCSVQSWGRYFKNASYGGPPTFRARLSKEASYVLWPPFVAGALGAGAACFVNAFFCFWRSFLRASRSFTRAAGTAAQGEVVALSLRFLDYPPFQIPCASVADPDSAADIFDGGRQLKFRDVEPAGLVSGAHRRSPVPTLPL